MSSLKATGVSILKMAKNILFWLGWDVNFYPFQYQYQDQNVCIYANILVLILKWQVCWTDIQKYFQKRHHLSRWQLLCGFHLPWCCCEPWPLCACEYFLGQGDVAGWKIARPRLWRCERDNSIVGFVLTESNPWNMTCAIAQRGQGATIRASPPTFANVLFLGFFGGEGLRLQDLETSGEKVNLMARYDQPSPIPTFARKSLRESVTWMRRGLAVLAFKFASIDISTTQWGKGVNYCLSALLSWQASSRGNKLQCSQTFKRDGPYVGKHSN